MRKQFGLSLIELMISITLGLILMTGVMKLFLSSKVVFSTQQGLSRIQETGRLAIDFISRDISEAGYYGCHRPDAAATDNNLKLQGSAPGAKGVHADFAISITGYDSVEELPELAEASTGAIGKPIPTTASLNANVLVVRSASQQGIVLNAANTKNELQAYSTASTDSAGCISDICPPLVKDAATVKMVAIVADCYKSRLFEVNSVTRGEGSTKNIITINHSDDWGGGDNLMENFINGAEVLAMNTHVYFLAQGAGGGPSLWQKTNTNPAFELLEGVEQMRFKYASETSNLYQPASEVSDWSKVWSVRIELLVRSQEDNVLSESQAYTLEGEEAVTPEDRRLRQIFTVTTALRNRITLN